MSIEVYGVKIQIETNRKSFFEEIEKQIYKIFPVKFKILKPQDGEHKFSVRVIEKNFYEFFRNGEYLGKFDREQILEFLESKLRVTVAEFSVSKVFLHAGVIAWKDKAIVLPGQSLDGKTTLVLELVKKGAVYYSDEYAVLDEGGFVYPFPKMLSLRKNADSFVQTDFPVEFFGGCAGTKRIPVQMIVFAKFDGKFKKNKWKPKQLSKGHGVLDIIPHTISIRNNTRFALKVLKKVTDRAILFKSKRGEAREFAELLIKFVESGLD